MGAPLPALVANLSISVVGSRKGPDQAFIAGMVDVPIDEPAGRARSRLLQPDCVEEQIFLKGKLVMLPAQSTACRYVMTVIKHADNAIVIG